MERVSKFLKEREREHLLRVLNPADLRREGKIYLKEKEYIDFSSNDYLGLSNHSSLKKASREAVDKWGTSSSASRLLSGDLNIHHQLEEKIAAFKGKEKALVFNSGYQANVGIISAICQKGDVIFSDRLNHASIIDAAILSRAKLLRFNHNDGRHLEFLLKRERKKFKGALIVTETVFSMDGDRCLLRELVGLKEKYDCLLMIDEAHATGIFGRQGSGLAEEEGVTEGTDLIMGTFSKALGSLGAYLAATKQIIDYLINSCRSFIYSTALPPAVIAANLVSLDIIKAEPFRRKMLLENASYLRRRLQDKGFKVKGSSQIIPLIVNDTQRAVKLAQLMQAKGYWVLPIRYPTVPYNEARLRVSLTYHHKKEILEKFVNELNKISI